MQNKKRTFLAFVIFILTFLIGGYYSTLGIDLHHQGIMYNAAKCVLLGKKLYKETYYHYGPIVAYLHASALYILSDKLVSIQLFTAFCYSIFFVQFFLFLTKELTLFISLILTFSWFALAPFFILDFLPWSSVIVLIPFTFLLYSFIYYKSTRLVIFFWGFIVSIIFLTRQSVGLPLIILFPICLILRNDIKFKIYYFLGFTILLSSFFFFMQINGILDFYIQSAIFGQFKFVHNSIGIQSKNIFLDLFYLLKIVINDFFIVNIYFEKYSIFWRLILLFFILLFISNSIKMYSNKNYKGVKIELAIFILSAVSLIQLFPVPDIRHYYWSFSPIIPLITIRFINYYKVAKINSYALQLKTIIISFILFSILFLLNLNYRITSAIINFKEYNLIDTNHIILSGMKINNAEKYFFDSVVNFKDNIVVQQSDFMPLMLTNLKVKSSLVINSNTYVSNFPFTNKSNYEYKLIVGKHGYREKIRNNGRIAYFNSDTLYFKKSHKFFK
jgi:hypothetical protein